MAVPLEGKPEKDSCRQMNFPSSHLPASGRHLCPRCGAPLAVWSMSFFNTEEICSLCKDDERQAPGFVTAHAIEAAAVKNGNYNFPGIGLSEADRSFLAERLRQRRADRSSPDS